MQALKQYPPDMQAMLKRAVERLVRGRTRMLLTQPFFGFVALQMRLVPDLRGQVTETLATNGKVIIYNRDWAERTPFEEIIASIAKEVMHVAYKHHLRRGVRDVGLWNAAASHVVNLELRDARFKLPASALCDSRFQGASAEAVYTVLKSEALPSSDSDGDTDGQGGERDNTDAGDCDDDSGSDSDSETEGGDGQDGDSDSDTGSDSDSDGDSQSDNSADSQGGGEDSQGDSGDGSGDGSGGAPGDHDSSGTPSDGAGGSNGGQPSGVPSWGNLDNYPQNVPSPGGQGGVFDLVGERGDPLLDAAQRHEEEMVDVMILQAATAAKTAGKVPGFAQILVNGITKPKEDWRARLRRFFDRTMPHDYTWLRPSRRYAHMGLYLPSIHKENVGGVVVHYDTSGSISSDEHETFQAELLQILSQVDPEYVLVLYFDSRLAGWQVFRQGLRVTFDHIKPVGGGGTDFRPSFLEMPDVIREEHLLKPKCHIVFTDYYCNAFPERPREPVMWVSTTDRESVRSSGYLTWPVPFGEYIHLSID